FYKIFNSHDHLVLTVCVVQYDQSWFLCQNQPTNGEISRKLSLNFMQLLFCGAFSKLFS
ncbi:unnamed protein product, partial [Larinioides sclopetarius]